MSKFWKMTKADLTALKRAHQLDLFIAPGKDNLPDAKCIQQTSTVLKSVDKYFNDYFSEKNEEGSRTCKSSFKYKDAKREDSKSYSQAFNWLMQSIKITGIISSLNEDGAVQTDIRFSIPTQLDGESKPFDDDRYGISIVNGKVMLNWQCYI